MSDLVRAIVRLRLTGLGYKRIALKCLATGVGFTRRMPLGRVRFTREWLLTPAIGLPVRRVVMAAAG